MAWYMTELPAARPMDTMRSRRLIGCLEALSFMVVVQKFPYCRLPNFQEVAFIGAQGLKLTGGGH